MKQRELKFRIAVKTEEGIKFDYYKLEDIDGYSGKSSSSMIGGELLGRDEFTGYLDKFGKEIYEKDIIKQTWPHKDSKMKETSSKFFVIFREYSDEEGDNTDNHYGWDCQVLENKRSHTLIDIVKPKYPEGSSCEVISNSYQNPELLKD